MSDTTGGAQSGPAGWHADPFGRYELRYYDGTQWTEHVSQQGTQYIDQPVYSAEPEAASAVPAAEQPVQDQPVATPTDAQVAEAVTASAATSAVEEPVPAEIVEVTPAAEPAADPVVVGPPVINVSSVVINVVDFARMKTFWQAVLGAEVAQEFDGAFLWFKPQTPGGISIALQQVDHPTHGRNRVHLDSGVPDLAAAQAQIEALGGRLLEDQELSGFQWKVMADPEDNEFCIALQSVEDHMH